MSSLTNSCVGTCQDRRLCIRFSGIDEHYSGAKDLFLRYSLYFLTLFSGDCYMIKLGPSPNTKFPLPSGIERLCFLKNVVKNPNIIVGDYTYYDDAHGVENFEKNVHYLFDFIGDKLIIGKFCQIATGITFLMNGGNHVMDGFSTYPFLVFGEGWELGYKKAPIYPNKGDTIIGNDVWTGYKVTIMPGVKIGDGAIIGSCSVVTKDVLPYSIVAGNPARIVRFRFDEKTIQALMEIKWWDWSIDKIVYNIPNIVNADIEALKKSSQETPHN